MIYSRTQGVSLTTKMKKFTKIVILLVVIFFIGFVFSAKPASATIGDACCPPEKGAIGNRWVYNPTLVKCQKIWFGVVVNTIDITCTSGTERCQSGTPDERGTCVANPQTGCPKCISGFHWSQTYATCCKNEEVPECRTTWPPERQTCTTTQVCEDGNGCIGNTPTPADICGNAGYPGREACCFSSAHSPNYYCFTGNPSRQSGGCVCTLPPTPRPSRPPTGPSPNPTINPTCGGNNSAVDTALGCIQIDSMDNFLKNILGKVIFVASGIAFLLMAFGAFQVLTSAGSPEKVKAGSELITSALSGLLFIIFSVFLLKLIGVDILQIPGFGN